MEIRVHNVEKHGMKKHEYNSTSNKNHVSFFRFFMLHFVATDFAAFFFWKTI